MKSRTGFGDWFAALFTAPAPSGRTEQNAEQAAAGTKMLVAYEACGCRMMVLLDATNPEVIKRFRDEAYGRRLVVREERHERIGALRCAVHAIEELSASRY